MPSSHSKNKLPLQNESIKWSFASITYRANSMLMISDNSNLEVQEAQWQHKRARAADYWLKEMPQILRARDLEAVKFYAMRLPSLTICLQCTWVLLLSFIPLCSVGTSIRPPQDCSLSKSSVPLCGCRFRIFPESFFCQLWCFARCCLHCLKVVWSKCWVQRSFWQYCPAQLSASALNSYVSN